MTVIDVIDSMSREIFEHYKSLEEIFKKTIRNILAAGCNNDFSKRKCNDGIFYCKGLQSGRFK